MPSARDVTALVVGDQLADVASGLTEESESLDVVRVENATDARAVLAEDIVDVIVSEYDLPDRDGVTLLAEVRRHHPTLPFVLCTVDGRARVASAAIEHDVTAYIPHVLDGDVPDTLETQLLDIVADYRASLERRQDSARLEAILENTTDVVITVDAEGAVRDVNDAVEAVLGYSPGNLIGHPLATIIPPDLVADHTTAFETYLRTGERQLDWKDIQLPALHADGHTIPVSISFAEFTDDGDQYFTGTIRDITDRVEAERRLEEREQRFHQVAENIQEVVWMATPDKSETIYVNPAYETMWGESRDRLYEDPLSFLDAVHPEDRDRVADAIELQAMNEYEEEYRIVRPDGEVRWIHDRASTIQNDDGSVYRIVGVATDITERVETRKRLERQNDRLEEFTSVVSHDLRNPISIAMGNIELVQETVDHDRLDVARDALVTMNDLVTDLLTLARQGDIVGDPDAVDLRGLARDVWTTTKTPDATLRIEDDSPQVVQADGRALRQLIANLFQNAVSHSEHEVTVTLGGLDDGFYVADDGPGIPPEQRDDILDAGFTTSENGTGFGLSIVKRIVQAHDWEIAVTESAAGGARFEFTGLNRAETRASDTN